MEAVKEVKTCILCGESNFSIYKKKKGVEIVKCRCGLIFTRIQPIKEPVDSSYEKDEHSYYKYYLNNRKTDMKNFRERLDLIKKYKKSGSILDIGCAVGSLLVIARKENWEVAGIELNKEAANYCRIIGLPVKQGPFNKSLVNKKFNVVHLGNVIDHLEQPFEFLVDVKSALKDDSILILSTPDIDTLLAKITQIKPNEHLYYFTKKTLTRMLDKAGYEVLEIETIGRYKNLDNLRKNTASKNSLPISVALTLSRFVPIDKTALKISNDELLAVARPKISNETGKTGN